MRQADVYRMIQRRAENAGTRTKIGYHSVPATGITEYLRNGGELKIAQQMAFTTGATIRFHLMKLNEYWNIDLIKGIFRVFSFFV
ncbi:hypothetical protein [Noviherbaspirillum suwonense]|uniref:Uncharacterized protein n=1 Tax=Noviherbaspirillum suwonense TaxID=1224511 RepID=A0ABY1QM83_9BURK|nr:hypothetical protein [Noviherbaspirillum suwonense]SMP73110.1 hypothetical protein SAMN06295970_1195 [Noviherbaspirillum suwonense]